MAGLLFLGAALCLVVIWAMWASLFASVSSRAVPPAADGAGTAPTSIVGVSYLLVIGAGVLVAAAIIRLRRK